MEGVLPGTVSPLPAEIQRRPREELNPRGGPPLNMKLSRDAALSRIPAPHLLKQEQLQLAGATFRDNGSVQHLQIEAVSYTNDKSLIPPKPSVWRFRL